MKRFTDRFWRPSQPHLAPCPMPRDLVLPNGGRVLVIAPHADDETIGCGGTLRLLSLAGCTIRVLVVTDGAAGDPLHYVDDVVAVREAECRAAVAHLGVDSVGFLREPDGEVRNHRGLRARLAKEFLDHRPDWVMAPAPLDYHRDHVMVSLAALQVWRRLGRRCRLFYYEVWAPLPVTHVIDVGPALTAKQRALSEYALPLRYGNYRHATEGLMAYRGLFLPQGQGVGPSRAEAFLEEDGSGFSAALLTLRTMLDGKLKD